MVITDGSRVEKPRLRSRVPTQEIKGRASLGCVTSKGLWGQGPPPSQSAPCPPTPTLKGLTTPLLLTQQAGISHWAIGEEGAENSLCEFCEWRWPYRHQREKRGEKLC